MKSIILLLASMLLTETAIATNYICIDKDGNKAELSIQKNNRISWNEPWHSADSSGTFIGIEVAPYSEYKGFSKYHLESFYTTNDSFYVLAINKNANSFVQTVVVYLDHDDHIEAETVYNCQ